MEYLITCTSYRFVCGSVGYYDVRKEKSVSVKFPQKLAKCDRVFHTVSTSDDPIIRRVSTY